MNRVMIIAWKWRDLKDSIITRAAWEENREKGIRWWKGRFFDEYTAGVKVADDLKKTVFRPFFNKAWQYYKYEFRTKVLELRDDLLDHLFGALPTDGKALKNRGWRELLKRNTGLKLRVKSFVNEKMLEKETAALRRLEKKRQKSYVFDDSQKNLEHLEPLKNEYEAVVQSIRRVFYEGQPDTPTPPGEYLLELQGHFQQLLYSFNSN